MSTPLMLGMDLNSISEETLSIISNKELIAINQDVACIQAIPVKSYNGVEVWSKDLGTSNSDKKAFAFLNDTDTEKTVTIVFSEIGLEDVEVVRDAWTHEDIAVDGKITVTVPSHGTLVYTAEGKDVDVKDGAGSSTPSSEPSLADYNVGPMTAKELVSNGAYLIDVRSAEEFAKGHIKGAENIYYVEIEEKIASVVANKSTPIVLYCSMAKRSTQALQRLLDMGYTNVYNLGSMDNYNAKPTLTFASETCKVVTTGQSVKVNFTASSYDSPKVYVSAGKNSTFSNAVPIEQFKIPASSCYYLTLKSYLVQNGTCYAQTSSEFIYWSNDTVDVFAGDIRSQWKKATNGWGSLQINKTIDKNTFSLSGNKFSKGIGAHAESDIVMDIPSGAKKFVAVVGMDDEVIAQMTANKVKEPNFYGMIFHVYIDGKHVDQSSLLGITKHYVFDIDIPEGAKEIRLYTDHVAYTGKDYDHADWAVAGFINSPVKN
jgi:rhodanese-related sulfurtransferase